MEDLDECMIVEEGACSSSTVIRINNTRANVPIKLEAQKRKAETQVLEIDENTSFPAQDSEEQSSNGIRIAPPSGKDEYLEGQLKYSENCKRKSDFELITVLSQGSHSLCYKAQYKDATNKDKFFCMKYIDLPADFNNGLPSTLFKEIEFMQKLKHENIVTFFGVVCSTTPTDLYILLEFCPINLYKLIKWDQWNKCNVYESNAVRYIMRNLFHGLEYLHGVCVIHRNINPENICFTLDGVLKLHGFDTSTLIKTGDLTPNVTDLHYRAPELLLGSKKYTTAVDIWSAGCILAELLNKSPLFEGKSELKIWKLIIELLGVPTVEIWPEYNELSEQANGHKVYQMKKFVKEHNSQYCMNTLEFKTPPEELKAQQLLLDILIYSPDGRNTATECLNDPYFTADPDRYTKDDFSKIVKGVETFVQGTT